MTEVEVEVRMLDYLTVSSERSLSTEFTDSDGRRLASSGLRKSGRPYDIVVRICYEGVRKCFVKGRTAAGRSLVELLRAVV